VLWCAVVLLYCCDVVVLCCCTVGQLYCCAVGVLWCAVVLLCWRVQTKFCQYLLHFPISIKFGTPANHRLLSHYEFHENRSRGINVILTVVAMFILGDAWKFVKKCAHCEFRENEQREGRMLLCQPVKWRVERVTVWEWRTPCSHTVQHLSLFWLRCSLLMKFLSDGHWLQLDRPSVCHSGHADRHTVCPCACCTWCLDSRKNRRTYLQTIAPPD